MSQNYHKTSIALIAGTTFGVLLSSVIGSSFVSFPQDYIRFTFLALLISILPPYTCANYIIKRDPIAEKLRGNIEKAFAIGCSMLWCFLQIYAYCHYLVKYMTSSGKNFTDGLMFISIFIVVFAIQFYATIPDRTA